MLKTVDDGTAAVRSPMNSLDGSLERVYHTLVVAVTR